MNELVDGVLRFTAEPDGTRTRIWVIDQGEMVAGPTFSREQARAFARHLLAITEDQT